MTLILTLLSLCVPPAGFEFLDVEAVDGRPVVRYRPVELGPRPVRPLNWEGPAPADVRYGLATVGPVSDSALAVAWAPESRSLWVDANGDGRLAPDERHTLGPGSTLAVAATIADLAWTRDAPPERLPRTFLFRPGLLGAGPRFAVRGAMTGTLALGDRRVRVLLTDGNANGCFDDSGKDRAWVDLDADGRFDPVTERFPLGTPIVVGRAAYTITSDPWARAVSAHERDTRHGRLRLGLRTDGPRPEVESFAADLVSDTGELVAIVTLDEDRDVPVGRYRVDSVALRVPDASGRVWSYVFSGGRRHAINVAAGQSASWRLLDGLYLDVVAVSHGGAQPGDDVDVTPTLRLMSGLFLANCALQGRLGGAEQSRTAEIVLKSPAGEPLDRASSGFQ